MLPSANGLGVRTPGAPLATSYLHHSRHPPAEREANSVLFVQTALDAFKMLVWS